MKTHLTKYLSDEQIREKNARLTPHREKAIRAFGESTFHRLWSLGNWAWLEGLNRRSRRITEEHERCAVSVADLLEGARGLVQGMLQRPQPVFRPDAREKVWQHAESLLNEAIGLMATHAKRASEWRRTGPPVAIGPGRWSVRAWFVPAAVAAFPDARSVAPGDWAHLGLAIHLEDEAEDFEDLRKAYADLLAPAKRRGKGSSPRPRGKSAKK